MKEARFCGIETMFKIDESKLTSHRVCHLVSNPAISLFRSSSISAHLRMLAGGFKWLVTEFEKSEEKDLVMSNITGNNVIASPNDSATVDYEETYLLRNERRMPIA
ncbi:hypothetical protein DINM_002164 [Dirofilaria immitis]|nr:hypothetical protein [Dirofilaria immitis]